MLRRFSSYSLFYKYYSRNIILYNYKLYSFKQSSILLNNNNKNKNTKNKKITHSIDDLLKSGGLKKASSINQTNNKYKKTNDKNKNNTSIQYIGKSIKYINEGKLYLKWKNNHKNLLSDLSLLPSAKLRTFISMSINELFGFNKIYTIQQNALMEIIKPSKTPLHLIILSGTGSGKSLIYWMSCILYSLCSKPKLTIIVSPLISLINDQFIQLESIGIPTCVYYGSVSIHSRKKLFDKILQGDFNIIYTTPEKVISRPFLKLLLECNDKMDLQVVMDEAHCISEWGHDFRPQYMKLYKIREQFENIPIIATTATATPGTVLDIRKILNIPYAIVLKGILTRPNLKYIVRPKSNNYLQDIINEIKTNWISSSGIIYCLTRNETEILSELLLNNKIKSAVYHSGLTDGKKTNIQTQWLNNEINIIVATVAFGMGINKPDVRFVIHSSISTSLEAYYQQAGRAGRDGKEGTCILYYRDKDRSLASRIINASPLEQTEEEKHFIEEPSNIYYERKQEQLDDIVGYAQNKKICRQVQILHFFNEPVNSYKCGICDICENEIHNNNNKQNKEI